MARADAPRSGPAADGLVVVDKCRGMTSHDVVARLRRIAGTRRVGHAGTLDPMATGVLVLGVGRATRLLHHLVLADKAYDATIRLGQATDTDDADGTVLAALSAAQLSEDAVRVGMRALTGAIDQVPSTVSAIKVRGQRAYAAARQGTPLDLPARPVTVARFELLRASRPTDDLLDLDVAVECSSGTYVRALARDLGVALNVGGHLTALRRTRVGPFQLDRAHTLDELAERDDPITLPLADAVRFALPARELDDAQARELSYGRGIVAAGIAGTYGGFAPSGEVVALLRDDNEQARPVLVFTPAG